MAEFNIHSDSVDVTRIMEQIRQRIQEKRGRDYTEQQIHELATVKLERFLDPQQVRSDLVEHYRQLEPRAALAPDRQDKPGPPPETFHFDEHTIYASSRGTMGKLIRLIRKLLSPILKLFINLNSIVFALSRQSEINTWTLQLLQRQTDMAAKREELDALNFEVLNNLVVEMTRLSVDMKNHRSLVESVSGRLDFDERRARALESVVQSRSPQPAQSDDGESAPPSTGAAGRTRRRRRRSRRRPGTALTPDGPGPPTDGATEAGAQGKTARPASDTATLPAESAASSTVPPQRQETTAPPAPTANPSSTSPEPTTPPPAAAPSHDPAPPTPPPSASIVDRAPDSPSTPTPRAESAPAPAAAPAAESGAAPSTTSPTSTTSASSTTGDAGTDEQ